MKTNYGLMVYSGVPKYNVGDYIQSLAAKQYLPNVDLLVDREKLKEYNGPYLKMIMNGWYMHDPFQWPVSKKIDPLFISFHINSKVKDQMLSIKGVEYLKKHEPIGCRDLYTLDLLKEKGIDAYYSGCLTTTLDLKYKRKENVVRDKIYIVDPLFQLPNWDKFMFDGKSMIKGVLSGDIFNMKIRRKLLELVLAKDLLLNAEYINHIQPSYHSETIRFQNAEEILHKYSTAKLVITSRIHCALPCLALGTPVVFLNSGFNSATEACRVNSMINLFNTINIDNKKNIDANFEFPSGSLIDSNFKINNPVKYQETAKILKESCFDFVNKV